MRNVLAIMQRELLSLFCSPVAYIVIAGYLLITGVSVLWSGAFAPGKPASLVEVFFWAPWFLTVIVPAICMRTISEEYRAGTMEKLMTAPLSDSQMVLGKYLASLVFFVVMLAPTLVYLFLMQAYGSPDWGQSLASYLGLLLVGVAFTAFGVFASSLTSNQVVAWILGWVPLLLFAVLARFAANQVEGIWRAVFQQINVVGRYETFSKGLITTDGVVFFLAVAMLFIFLTVKVVESRRWR
ncbi:MAG: ABC transporter permease subunit [Phycisphaerales bacterium]|nr:ABC transporter permease subunit [Phycisphaerales bacterium]